MASIASKPSKSSFVVTKETLHSRHLEMCKDFKNAKKVVLGKSKYVHELEESLIKLEKQERTPDVVAKILETRDKLSQVNCEITKLESNHDEDNYYLKNGDLIFQYFMNIDQVANEGSDKPTPDADDEDDDGFGVDPDEDVAPVKGYQPKKTATAKLKAKKKPIDQPLMNFFKNSTDEFDNSKEMTVASNSSKPMPRSGSRGVGLHEFVERKENFQRAKLLDTYMSNIDPTYTLTLDRVRQEDCRECGSEMFVNQTEGISECQKCGYSELIKVDSDKKSYKEATNTEMTYLCYKRINHFDTHTREWNSGLKVCYPLVCSALSAACAAA